MNKLFLSLALLVVAPAFVVADSNKGEVVSKPKTAEEAVKAVETEFLKGLDIEGLKNRAIANFHADNVKETEKALAEAKKAQAAATEDEAKKTAAQQVSAAEAKHKDAKKSYDEFMKDKGGMIAFVKNQFDKLGLAMALHYKVAAVTVAAMTLAIVEAVHYVAGLEEEEVGF